MSLEKFFANPDAEKLVEGTNLIDFSQIVISTIMHTYNEGDKIDTKLVRHVVLNTLRYNVLKNKQLYPNIVICVDNSKDGYWRRKLCYYYKKNRHDKREESEWDWEGIFEGMHTVIAELKETFPYIVIDNPHTEADDVIGVLAEYISLNHPETPILITSSDGDFTQLQIHPKVKQWSPMQKKWVKPKHGSPTRDLLYKIIKGDKKDAVAAYTSPSDYWITRLDGEKQKSIKTKFMAEVFEAKDFKSMFEGEELRRIKENEILLDLRRIPDSIKNPILHEYLHQVPAKRGGIYRYFVKHALVKLLDVSSEF